jgi:type VI secretion system protein ImpE
MTTDARDLLRQGDVAGALKALQAQVRAEPAKSAHRVFLFQLLCVTGEWERALTQLSVAGDMDAGTLGMMHVYREAVKAEAFRREVFAGNKTPLIFGDPEQWVALLLEALKRTANGDVAQGRLLREQAFELAPASAGRLNDRPFEWLADADVRLGPMLEAIVNGRYYWIPFQRIGQLKIEQPQDLRDLVWLPAQIKWSNGGDAVALLPTRYPGSEQSSDPAIRLARRTEWLDQGDDVHFGLGQRMLATDGGEVSLMEVRSIDFDASVARPAGANG